MKNVKYLFGALFLLLAMSSITNAKDWRGIVPLHSTVEDVEKLLGKPRVAGYYVYETEEGQVMFGYQTNLDPSCGKGYKPYNVPFRTVLFIQIESKKKPLLVDLNLNMSKFTLYPTCFGATGYSNNEEGFGMHVYEKAVSTFYYSASAIDEKKYACPKANE